MNELIAAMGGRSLDNRFPPVDNTPGEVVLSVQHLSTKYAPNLQDISFDVREGEIFGLYGLVGAGRSELLETMFGVRTRAAGRVYYKGRLMNFNSSKDAMAHGFAMITEERKATGLYLEGDLTFNTTITNLAHYVTGVTLSKDKMVKATANQINIMHTKCMGPSDSITALSGGNQQKVIFGKWLERDPSVFLMDEPTRGIDVGAKYEIYEVINELAANGKAVIVISSDMQEIIGTCDRTYVLNEGEICGELSGADITQENIMGCIMTHNNRKGAASK
jgi:methyl-galactoside transport system ATP-binding protein